MMKSAAQFLFLLFVCDGLLVACGKFEKSTPPSHSSRLDDSASRVESESKQWAQDFVDRIALRVRGDFQKKRAHDALTRLLRPLPTSNQSVDPRRAVEGVNATYYFLLGHRLSQKGRAGEALLAFDQLKKIDSESAEVFYFLAQEYLKKGMMSEGVSAARKALELNPKYKDAKLFLANLYATAKKYSEATQLFEELSRENPDDEDIMLYLALIETEQKQSSRAYQRITKFLQNNPESALGYYYLGRLQQERGESKAAEASYRRAIDVRPGFVQAGTFLGFLQEERGDRDAAIDTYSWLAAQTDDLSFHKKLGNLLLDGNQYQGALKSFENFERLDKKDLNNKVKIALLHVEFKAFDKAIQKFEEVLKEAPDSDNVRYYLAAVYEQKNDAANALAQYTRIAPTSKLYADALKRRIYAYARAKNFDEGWKLLQLSAQSMQSPKEASKETVTGTTQEGSSSPISTEEIYEMGVNFLEAFPEKESETQTYLAQALDKFPRSEKLLYLKGSLLEKQSKINEAIAVMQKIIEINPNNASALNFVGYSWAERGVNLSQAESYVKRALKLKPKEPFISDSLGWIYFKQGRYQEALKILEEAFAARPDEAVIADHLGDVLVKLGRLDDARKYYELALKLGPSKESDRKNLEQKLARLQGAINSGCNNGNSDGCAGLVFDNPRSPATTRSSR